MSVQKSRTACNVTEIKEIAVALINEKKNIQNPNTTLNLRD
jgi:hypothetical protein